MALIQIEEDRYGCPEEWVDISLDRAIRLHEVCAEAPKRIRERYGRLFDETAPEVVLSDEELRLFADFQRRVVEVLCAIPAERMDKADPHEIAEIYYGALEPFVVSMMYQPIGFEPSGEAYFDWQGERYYYPASGKDMTGKPAYMEGLSALQLAQITDLAAAGERMAAGEYRYAATMVAIVCLRKGESYSEELVKERTPLFATVPMSVVLEVFFCLQQLTAISQMNIRIAMAKRGGRTLKARRRVSCFLGRSVFCWLRNVCRSRRRR